jgi:hypothetical protein
MSTANGRKLETLIRKAIRWLPISSCYECRHRNVDQCRCLLTDRKRNRHPHEGIPAWCPLPNTVVEPLVRCLRCDKIPKAQRVRVPHLTWAVYCKCGRHTGYFSGGKAFAVRAWNTDNMKD